MIGLQRKSDKDLPLMLPGAESRGYVRILYQSDDRHLVAFALYLPVGDISRSIVRHSGTHHSYIRLRKRFFASTEHLTRRFDLDQTDQRGNRFQ